MNKEEFLNRVKIVSGCRGGSLVGTIDIPYQKLVALLGNSDDCLDDKTDAEWNICFDGCAFYSIYNYKNGKNYDPIDGLEVEDITEWNIGGTVKDKVDELKNLLQSVDVEYSTEKVINLPIYNIKVTIKKGQYGYVDGNFDDINDNVEFVIKKLIIQHAMNGVDIKSNGYVAGIQSVIEYYKGATY
jgi:hypothetical protein